MTDAPQAEVLPKKKKCTICKLDKDLDLFDVDLRTNSGRASSCKECNGLRCKDRKREKKEFAEMYRFQ